MLWLTTPVEIQIAESEDVFLGIFSVIANQVCEVNF